MSTGPTSPAKQPVEDATPRRPGRVRGFFERARRWVADVKSHPVRGAIYVAVVFLASLGVGEVFSRAVAKLMDDDQYIENLRIEQAKGFADIKADLSRLRRSGDADVVRSVATAVDRMDAAQRKLIGQLELAKQESDRQAEALRAAGRSPGGFDFILSEAGGQPLSDAAFLGLQWVQRRSVRANLSTVGGETLSAELYSGQSLPFRDDKGRQCNVALLSIEGDAASFKVGCEPK